MCVNTTIFYLIKSNVDKSTFELQIGDLNVSIQYPWQVVWRHVHLFFCFGLKRSQFHVAVLVCLFSWLAMSTKKSWKKYRECYCWKVYRLFPLPVWSFMTVQLSMKPRTRPTATKYSINNSKRASWSSRFKSDWFLFAPVSDPCTNESFVFIFRLHYQLKSEGKC